MLISTSKNNVDAAGIFQLVAARLPGQTRKALGQSGSLIYQRRKELIDETIYQRGPQDRPLSYNLKDSEYFEIRGNKVLIGNSAEYAVVRGEEMEGTSVMYGHDLTSHFASRAIEETEKEREELARKAISDSWN